MSDPLPDIAPCDFIGIADGDEGTSITNAGTYHGFQVAHRLGLEWNRCVLVENYAHADCDTVARIHFAVLPHPAPPAGRAAPGRSVKTATDDGDSRRR